jgi:hypothetical protein
MKALPTRIAAVAILLASLVALVPATAVAETKTYRFTISGTEVSATSTTGRFVGTASGSALGTWYAEVNHEPLGGVLARASPSDPVAPSGWPWPRRHRPMW